MVFRKQTTGGCYFFLLVLAYSDEQNDGCGVEASSPSHRRGSTVAVGQLSVVALVAFRKQITA